MRAFLSHSSADKALVTQVYVGLERDSTWLDRAEIEWGDLFLEKISDGIRSANDFVLFWSASAARSEWVRLELNMAFVRMLRDKAIRIRVIVLDNTPIPLYLQPYQVLSVANSHDPVRHIISPLSALLKEPVRPERTRFVNRHSEIERIESAVDDPEVYGIWLFGFTGVGKTELVNEALRRIFEGASVVKHEVTQGTGFVELALALNALVRGEGLEVSLPQAEVERQIRLSVETIARDGRLLLLTNAQHWLDEEFRPDGPLKLLLDIVAGLPGFARHPVIWTSTRRPTLEPPVHKRVTLIQVKGLADEHIAVLIRNWYFTTYGRELPVEDAARLAPQLYGHPVAARLIVGVLGDHSVDYLEKYPREVIVLRRDLARVLLQDLRISPSAGRLMEILALAGVALPASAIASTGFSDEDLQQAVEDCSRSGLITADLRIEAHPLFREFFWHRLHRRDYREEARRLALALRDYLAEVDKKSTEYVELLPVAYRAFALAGDLAAATTLRRDLLGELEAAAITLYNRRNYPLSDKYIGDLLQADPNNWRLRLYRLRIRVRQEEWAEADQLISAMLQERPGDIGVLHAKGWRFLRQHRFEDALTIFAQIVARREHAASLRDSAECLHRLGRNEEALNFLHRAKAVESENPFVLDLESRILEDIGQLQPAYDSALLASARDPLNSHLHHRMGQIRVKQGRSNFAIPHFAKAVELDSDNFTAANSLTSAYLDTGNLESAEGLLQSLAQKAQTPAERALVQHATARLKFYKGDPLASEKILKQQLNLSANKVPNLGLLVQVELALFDQNYSSFPTIASVSLATAEDALNKIIDLDPANKFIESFSDAIRVRRSLGGPKGEKSRTAATD